MSKWFRIACLASLAILSQGCSRYLKTKEIIFSRNPKAVDGNPIAVDIIYPRSIEEREQIVKEFNSDPNKWFSSEYYKKNKMIKDKADVPAGSVVTQRVSSQNRPKKEIGLVIIAEFGQRSAESSPKQDQHPIIALEKDSYPPPKRKELIWIDQGFMERLERSREQ